MPEVLYEEALKPSVLASSFFWLGGLMSVVVWTSIAVYLLRSL